MPITVNEKNGIRMRGLAKPGQAYANRLLRRVLIATKRGVLKLALCKGQEVCKGEG